MQTPSSQKPILDAAGQPVERGIALNAAIQEWPADVRDHALHLPGPADD